MATNEILPFAETDTTTNLLTQVEYAGDSQRPIGNQPGVARSKLVNKVLRQTSKMAAGLGKMAADLQATNITDSLTTDQMAAALQAALDAHFAARLNAAQVVLPGAMMMWPKSTAPAGWLKRNGAAISRTAYADLFAVIGTTFGAGDGSTTFNLPDDRAVFERGWDDARGVDPGRVFGSEQSSQNLSHSHTGTTGNNSSDHTHSGLTSTTGNHSHTNPLSQLSGQSSVGTIPQLSGQNSSYQTGAAGDHQHSFTTGGQSGVHNHAFTTSGSGGSESRPFNRAYLPIIKF